MDNPGTENQRLLEPNANNEPLLAALDQDNHNIPQTYTPQDHQGPRNDQDNRNIPQNQILRNVDQDNRNIPQAYTYQAHPGHHGYRNAPPQAPNYDGHGIPMPQPPPKPVYVIPDEPLTNPQWMINEILIPFLPDQGPSAIQIHKLEAYLNFVESHLEASLDNTRCKIYSFWLWAFPFITLIPTGLLYAYLYIYFTGIPVFILAIFHWFISAMQSYYEDKNLKAKKLLNELNPITLMKIFVITSVMLITILAVWLTNLTPTTLASVNPFYDGIQTLIIFYSVLLGVHFLFTFVGALIIQKVILKRHRISQLRMQLAEIQTTKKYKEFFEILSLVSERGLLYPIKDKNRRCLDIF